MDGDPSIPGSRHVVLLLWVWALEVPFAGITSLDSFSLQQTLSVSYWTIRSQIRVTHSRRHLQILPVKPKLTSTP